MAEESGGPFPLTFEILTSRIRDASKLPMAKGSGIHRAGETRETTLKLGDRLDVTLKTVDRADEESFTLYAVDNGIAQHLAAGSGMLIRATAWEIAFDGDSASIHAAAPQGPFGAGTLLVAANVGADWPADHLRITELYLDGSAEDPTIFAVVDSQNLTGAFRLEISGADNGRVSVDVTAHLFFRGYAGQIGISPLTSMYLFGPTNRGVFDDYRPRVHDSDGLWIHSAEGQTSWRPLTNPSETANSYIAMETPEAFGLMQRAIGFDAYQDADHRYDRRPSVVVEPRGRWGEGFVRLIERPLASEDKNNILAMWMPREVFTAGQELEIAYQIRWENHRPDDASLAYVEESRAGVGGVSGVENAPSLRKFVIDFRGRPLLQNQLHTQIDAFVDVSHGSIAHTTISRLPGLDRIRLVVDAYIEEAEPAEPRAYLMGNGRQLTESWLYQWRRPK